jgi:hypothetical protein
MSNSETLEGDIAIPAKSMGAGDFLGGGRGAVSLSGLIGNGDPVSSTALPFPLSDFGSVGVVSPSFGSSE